ncbi:MAG TPA: DUF460 domain-containing protein [Methanocorpusculum sp.]|nr:DUF460 domain-containing protein [Methanocorpusculum sp.]
MNTLIFGIETVRGYIENGSNRPNYALVRVSERRIESEERNIPLSRLLRMIDAERPAILAIGNIRDFTVGAAGLYGILNNLPYGTKLVQISGDGIRMEPIAKIAERYNLRFDKTNPMEEAKTAALIASFGGGYEVLAYEDVTTVTVFRAGSLARSHRRHVPKMHEAVQSRSREIEAKLSAKGLSYLITSRRVFHGGSMTIFRVRAPRTEVPVSSRISGGVWVRVSGKRKEKPAFVSLSKKPAYIIVGIDPGTTAGIAVLNLDGDLIHLSSPRILNPAEIISGIGKPVLIATDKADIPSVIEKIRRAFSAVAWKPAKDMLIKDKHELTEGHDFSNDHERDALSAAVSAYRSYANKFDSVRKRMPPGTDFDVVRAGIIRGLSLENIIAGIENPEEAPVEPEVIPVDLVSDEKDEHIAQLEESLTKLRKLAGSLSEEVEVKDKAIFALQKQLVFEREERKQEVRQTGKISSRDTEEAPGKKAPRSDDRQMRNMRMQIERMKHFISLQAGEGCTALKILQILGEEHLKSLDDEMGVGEEDILYVLKIDGWDKSVVRRLADAKIGAVILPRLTFQRAQSQNLIEEFRDAGVPILDGTTLSPRVKGTIGVVNTAEYETALAGWKETQVVYNNEKKSGQIHGKADESQIERVKRIGPEMESETETQESEPVQVPKRDKHTFMSKPERTPVQIPAKRIENAVQKPIPVQTPAKRIEKAVQKPTPVQTPAKRIEKAVQKPKPMPKPAPAPLPKKQKPVPKPVPVKKPAEKDGEKTISHVLFGVLSEYRAERKKELKK